MLRVALLLAVACVPSAVAFDSARCADYASKGYCTHNDYKEYMGKFCTDSCAEGGQAEASADEDASCGRWILWILAPIRWHHAAGQRDYIPSSWPPLPLLVRGIIAVALQVTTAALSHSLMPCVVAPSLALMNVSTPMV